MSIKSNRMMYVWLSQNKLVPQSRVFNSIWTTMAERKHIYQIRYLLQGSTLLFLETCSTKEKMPSIRSSMVENQQTSKKQQIHAVYLMSVAMGWISVKSGFVLFFLFYLLWMKRAIQFVFVHFYSKLIKFSLSCFRNDCITQF